MKKKIVKSLALVGMLALGLLLTGCYVRPDDLNAGGDISVGGKPYYQTVGIVPTATPDPTNTPYVPVTSNTPEPTTDQWWLGGSSTAAPTVQGSIGTGTQPTSGIVTLITPVPGAATATPTAAASGVTSLKPGSQGEEVRKLQRRLKELGYYKGSVDGDYGEGTATAVEAFQRQHGLDVDGKAGPQTQNKLYSSSAKRAPSTVTATPRRTATPTPRATSVPDTDVYLEEGSSGSKVRTLQNRLIELGWMAGKADGTFAGATEYAVRAFQRKHSGLESDGVAGPGTLSILYSNRAAKASTPVSSVGETLQEGQSSAAVRAMQTRLKSLGYLSGSADGSFGTATKAAVIAFQTANGLRADGRAGTSTLNALYSEDAKDADSLNNSSNGTIGGGVSIDGYRTLREGDSGAEVRNLQRALKNRGYYSGSIDGNYGSGTVAAVTAFQKRNGLTVDGTAGPATQRALYGSSADDAYDTLRPGDQGAAVRNLQYTLYELGYYDDRVDGIYGNTTEDAVRAFQIRNNLTPVDGIAGNKTQQKLYSDSAVAAAAATTQYTSLRKGDRSNLVVEMQEALQNLGYLSEVTGYYDDATVEAVKNFQRRNGLSVDGTAGQETLRKLYTGNPKTAY